MERKIKLQLLKDRFEKEYKKCSDLTKKCFCYIIIKKIEKELRK